MRYRRSHFFRMLLLSLCMLFAATDLQARDLTPEREALPMSQVNAQAHKLVVAPGAAFRINPILIVPPGMQGQSSDLYAMAMINGRMMVKTPTGWQDYVGSLSVFDRVVLGPSLQTFEFDSGLVNVDAGDSIDFYYFYNGYQLSLRGNGMRFDLETGGECDVFEIPQSATAIETVDVTELPQATVSAACRTIAPRLHVPAEDQGHLVYLYAAILTDDDLMIKTAAGWLPYDGVNFPWFSAATLDAELADFDLPVNLVGGYEGEVWFYYAYLIEQEVLMGNALQLNISDMVDNLHDLLDYVVMIDNHPGSFGDILQYALQPQPCFNIPQKTRTREPVRLPGMHSKETTPTGGTINLKNAPARPIFFQ